jgi:hypothetical protein
MSSSLIFYFKSNIDKKNCILHNFFIICELVYASDIIIGCEIK